MLLFRRCWQKLIAYVDRIFKSVKLDRFLRYIVVLIVFLLCVDGAILVVWKEVFSDLIHADVPFVGFGLIGFSLSCAVVAWVKGRSSSFAIVRKL